ncbi:hypothetical protein N4T77_00530 [Clostridium sp. CX1]|uniref:hypothetical protein n=1 Tax=Clostridium sp. CX1 TaxID=2978346 RepID=UPI0021C1E4B6|nr:hypothetical protein [Clostridium sp. CX1]MCT8975075.1 hypothetical protein [Clostridium sp. CX1]
MKIEDIAFSALLAVGLITLTFRGLIKKNLIKPSKISRIFYQDDESFINYWEKAQEKGILNYIIKKIIYMTITFGIMNGISVLYKKQAQTVTLFGYLLICVIAGGLYYISWGDNQNKYNELKEKEDR